MPKAVVGIFRIITERGEDIVPQLNDIFIDVDWWRALQYLDTTHYTCPHGGYYDLYVEGNVFNGSSLQKLIDKIAAIDEVTGVMWVDAESRWCAYQFEYSESMSDQDRLNWSSAYLVSMVERLHQEQESLQTRFKGVVTPFTSTVLSTSMERVRSANIQKHVIQALKKKNYNDKVHVFAVSEHTQCTPDAKLSETMYGRSYLNYVMFSDDSGWIFQAVASYNLSNVMGIQDFVMEIANEKNPETQVRLAKKDAPVQTVGVSSALPAGGSAAA